MFSPKEFKQYAFLNACIFLKKNNNFLFTNLVASTICFEYYHSLVRFE